METNPRIKAFVSAAATLPAYQGGSADDIRANVTDVLSSGDDARIGRFVSALSSLPAYKGGGHEDILANVRDVFGLTNSPLPTPVINLSMGNPPATTTAEPPAEPSAEFPDEPFVDTDAEELSDEEKVDRFNKHYAKLAFADDETHRQMTLPAPELRQGKRPNWLARAAKRSAAGNKYDTSHDDIIATNEQLDRIEAKGDGFIPGFVRSFDLGNKAVDADRWMSEAVKSGDPAAIDAAEDLIKRISGLQEEHDEKHKGIVSKNFHAVAGMSGPMVRSMAANALPGPARVAGKVANFEYWMEQGKGDFLNRVKAEGYDPEKAQNMAMIVGAAYAGVQELEIGQLAKLALGKKAFDSVRKKILGYAVNALKTGAVQTAEEVLQEGIEQAGLLVELKAQGHEFEEGEAAGRMKDALVEEAKGAVGPMFLTSAIGATAGGIKNGIAQSLLSSEYRPFVKEAVSGETIRAADGAEFRAKPGDNFGKAMSSFRGWARKHNKGGEGFEVVKAEAAKPEAAANDPAVTGFKVVDGQGNEREWSEFEGEPVDAIEESQNPPKIKQEEAGAIRKQGRGRECK